MPRTPQPSGDHAQDKSARLSHRLSAILARLHQGEALDKHQLVKEFSVDVRTIERDLTQRLHNIVERNAAGLWQLTQASRAVIPSTHLQGYARLAGTDGLFPDTSLRYLLEQIATPEQRRATHVQPTAQEDLGAQGPQFALLQTAVEQRHECRFTYKGKPRHAQPYRLLHKNGVWYLSAEEGGKLKNFSISLIETLQVDEASRFTPNRAHQDYIKAKDDVWFTEGTTEVLLRVAPEMAHYFTRRQLLPKQQQREDNDGSLLVTTQINHINQLLPVVRYWLPHVRIVQPTAWHQELMDGLRQALAQWED